MTLVKREYKSYDVIKLALEASPICTVLDLLLPITQSIMQTVVMAMATASFVDTATDILNNMQPCERHKHSGMKGLMLRTL